MTRVFFVALFICGMALSMVGCTNTVRGLGQDVNSDAIQDYNRRTASDLDY